LKQHFLIILVSTVATVCVFLASKMEDTPCLLKHVVIVAYETMYQKNPDAAKRIHQEEVLAKQKALILVGETLLLSTIRFDFNIQHPYEPLKFALKKLGIVQKELRQSAMALINDMLPTTLVVQFKPHYIAAGSLCLAAEFHNVDLSQNEIIWWHVFDVALDPLKVVVQQMCQLFKKRAPCSMGPVIKPVPTSSAMDKHQIKLTPTLTPSPMDKHQILIPTPAPIYRHQSKPIPTPMDKQQSNLAFHPMDKQQMKPAPTPMDKQQIKLAAAPAPAPMYRHQIKPIPTPMDKQQSNLGPTPMDKQQMRMAAAPVLTDRQRIVSAPVPALRHTQSSRRNFSDGNTEVSSCVTTSSSFNKNSTGRSPRNEGNWYRGKNEENPYWRRHINHNLEHRLEERSNQRTLKSDLAYLVRSGPKDTNATEIKNLTRQKRRIQEVGGLPTPVYMTDTNAWRQGSGVIVFETTSSRQKQKVERR